MLGDDWPLDCRKLLLDSVASAARQFPGPGEQARERVYGVRRTLKEARAIARLFLPSLGSPPASPSPRSPSCVDGSATSATAT